MQLCELDFSLRISLHSGLQPSDKERATTAAWSSLNPAQITDACVLDRQKEMVFPLNLPAALGEKLLRRVPYVEIGGAWKSNNGSRGLKCFIDLIVIG